MKKEILVTAGILLLSILGLWIYKIPYLWLPCFGDEAFSYARAYWAMYQNHPCLLPGCILPDLYRGHPLFFYFMAAMATKVFGFSPLVLHTSALILSTIFLILFFSILVRLTSPLFALLGTLLLLSQEAFIAQSSFMLPEVFISTLTLVTVMSLLAEKKLIYVLSASILALSKESGLVIVAAITLVAFIFLVKENRRNGSNKISLLKQFLLLAFPPLIGIGFYVCQKIICGWYFFPLHIQLMDVSMTAIRQHWNVISDFVFFGYLRQHLVWLSGLIIALLLIYRKRLKVHSTFMLQRITVLLIVAFIFYFLFSLVNWIILRYLIPLIVIFIFLIIIWSYQIHQVGFKFFPFLFCMAICISLYHDFTFNPTWIDDVSLRYVDNVTVDQQAVAFMENNDAFSKKIFTSFLMEYNLTSPELFYLHGAAFQDVHSDELLKDADYYIFGNVLLNDVNYAYAKSNDSLQLIKRLDKGNAWCEIYQRMKN